MLRSFFILSLLTLFSLGGCARGVMHSSCCEDVPAVTPPPVSAADNFSKVKAAAEKGDVTAQAALAYIYFRGNEGAPDFSAAATWYRKAAEQGNASAQYNLSAIYFNGYGVEQDYKEACFWLLLFSSSLSQPPPELNEAIEEIGAKLSSEQLRTVKTRVVAWTKAHPSLALKK